VPFGHDHRRDFESFGRPSYPVRSRSCTTTRGITARSRSRRSHPAVEWIRGRAEWRDGAVRIPFRSPRETRLWADNIWLVGTVSAMPACPRVFISHRQVDYDQALRIAWLADQHRFDFWLDVIDLDPTLDRRSRHSWLGLADHSRGKSSTGSRGHHGNGASQLHARTGVADRSGALAMDSLRDGRVKQPTLTTDRAASWWNWTTVTTRDLLPEYVHLGPVLDREIEIENWMDRRSRRIFASCPGARSSWNRGPTVRLPTGVTNKVGARRAHAKVVHQVPITHSKLRTMASAR